MALDERSFSREQFVDLTCETEHFTLYSSNAGFTDPPTYYQSDYDWQHSQTPQNQALSQQAHLHESERHYYPGYTEENTASNHAYTTYGQQSVSHADFFPQVHGIWSSENLGDTLQKGQINQHHMFFPVDVGQQSADQQTSATSSITGKPKRKRVQSHSQRKAANVRERRRMFHLNEAFDELRKRLPAFNYEKRLSRIETLRLAMTYISFMKEVSIGQDPKCVKLKPHGADLPLSNCNLLSSPHPSYISSDNNDDCSVKEESDCSNDELSNHSEENC